MVPRDVLGYAGHLEIVKTIQKFILLIILTLLQVFNSQNHDMVVNISTNQPVFQVRGLTSGTEYRVRIYSVNDNGGVSEQTVFETFTLQVSSIKDLMIKLNFFNTYSALQYHY